MRLQNDYRYCDRHQIDGTGSAGVGRTFACMRGHFRRLLVLAFEHRAFWRSGFLFPEALFSFLFSTRSADRSDWLFWFALMLRFIFR